MITFSCNYNTTQSSRILKSKSQCSIILYYFILFYRKERKRGEKKGQERKGREKYERNLSSACLEESQDYWFWN